MIQFSKDNVLSVFGTTDLTFKPLFLPCNMFNSKYCNICANVRNIENNVQFLY